MANFPIKTKEGFTAQPVVGVHPDTGEPMGVENVRTFREAYEISPVDSANWVVNVAPGDLVFASGTAAGASYKVMSKSPWNQGSETTVETVRRFKMPLEFAIGFHMSQRTLGQEFAIELVDDDLLTDISDLVITSISQSGTTVTLNTGSDHKMAVGKCLGVAGCVDQRLNYPSLVVQATPNPRQLLLVGEGAALPSLSIGYPVIGSKGTLYFRERFGRAQNGVSQIFQNTSATNAALYVRSEQGDALMSGTPAGSHSQTVGSTASTQTINSPYNYAFDPSTEFQLSQMVNAVQWSDSPVDTLLEATNRRKVTRVCPSPAKNYKLRFRATNNKSLTVIGAKVISVVKTSSTTATFTVDRDLDWLTGDQVVYYGSNSQAATDAPNLLVATPIASLTPRTFTAVIGTGTVGSFFGGYVAKVQGGNLMSALGASAVTAINATLTTLVDGTRQLVLTGNTNWASLLIGDMVEAVGIRSSIAVPAGDLGVDGAWMVAAVATNQLTLVPPPEQDAFVVALPADFALTVCGGGIVKRTCGRTSFVRVFDFDRLRVEMAPRPAGDLSNALPVAVKNTVPVTMTSTGVAGSVAQDSAAGNPVGIGGRAANANQAAMSAAGDLVHQMMTMIGAGVMKPYAIPEAEWVANLALTATTDVAIQTVAGAGIKRHITQLWMINTGVATVDAIIKDGTTERVRFPLPVNVPVPVPAPTSIPTTANTALNAALSAAGTVRLVAFGYTAP